MDFRKGCGTGAENLLGPFCASSLWRYSKSVGCGKWQELTKAFCFFLAFSVVMSLAPKMLSGLASFKSDANMEGQDRNSQWRLF